MSKRREKAWGDISRDAPRLVAFACSIFLTVFPYVLKERRQ
jgi:hypothetical protein